MANNYVVLTSPTGGSGGGSPTGSAGGDLGGTYPNPVVDQAQSGAITFANTGLITLAASDTAGGITQTAPATDLATHALTIQAQPAHTGAATNVTGASININSGAGTGAAAFGGAVNVEINSGAGQFAQTNTLGSQFQVTSGGVRIFAVSPVLNNTNGSAALFVGNLGNGLLSNAQIYVGANGVTNFFGASHITMAPNNIFIGQFLTSKEQYWVTGANIALGSAAAGSYGGGAGVMQIANAQTVPSSNTSTGVLLYSSGGDGYMRGQLGAVTTIAATGSNLTVNTQSQIMDTAIGTCRTVSSATPTTILNYNTKSGVGGTMTVTVTSRAITTGTGIAIGNTSSNIYVLAWQNIAGTVTLSTAGITILGTGQTTAAAMTAPTLTASASGATLTIFVTNNALATIDSQAVAKIVLN
jgi:hypothetical protein